MIKLTPTPNTKWKNIKTGRIFSDELILGIHDSPANYELVDISEYEAQMKKEEEKNKEAELEEALKKAEEEARKAKEALKQAKSKSIFEQIREANSYGRKN